MFKHVCVSARHRGARGSFSQVLRFGGFTLVELMVTVAIIAVLAAVAIPRYQEYVVRSRLSDGQRILSAYSLTMEQYFQNNNTYVKAGGGCGIDPTGSSYTTKDFTLACVGAATTFTATLTGQTTVSGYVYEINQDGRRRTTSFKGATKTGVECWLIQDGSAC